METLILLFFLGCVVGFVGGYAGISGAPFLVALLVALFGMTQFEAQGTVLAVMLGPMSLMSIITLWDKVKPNIPIIIIGVIGYAIMSYFGASLAYLLPERILKIIFGCLLLLLGGYDLWTGTRKLSHRKKEVITTNSPSISYSKMMISGSLIGIIGGLFGIGAGVLMVPIFINYFNIPKDEARAISLGILLPPVSVGAVLKYNMEGAINWQYALIIFISYFAVNYFGGKCGGKHSLQKFKIYFGIILILLGMAYFYLIFWQ